MMDSGPNKIGSNNPIPPSQPDAPNSSQNPFARMFPTATPDELKKITQNFINFTIQQMKADQQHMLDALKQMQYDQDQ
jgi:hypothetical protein